MSKILYTQVYQFLGGETGTSISQVEDFQEFFELTRNSIPEWPVTNSPTPYPYGKSFQADKPGVDTLSDGTKLDCRESKKFGILKYLKTAGSGINKYIYFGSPAEDFDLYLTMIYTKTDAEIREEYKDWEVIMKKYEFMLSFLRKHGLDAFIKGNGD